MLLRDFPQPKSPDRDTQAFSPGDTHSSPRGVQTNPPDPRFPGLPAVHQARLRRAPRSSGPSPARPIARSFARWRSLRLAASVVACLLRWSLRLAGFRLPGEEMSLSRRIHTTSLAAPRGLAPRALAVHPDVCSLAGARCAARAPSHPAISGARTGCLGVILWLSWGLPWMPSVGVGASLTCAAMALTVNRLTLRFVSDTYFLELQ
jgi:hypothetical protein